MDDGSSDGSGSKSKGSSNKKSTVTAKKSKVGSENYNKSKGGKSAMESAEEQDFEEDEMSEKDDDVDRVTQDNMREELIKAIKDELAEYKQLKETNLSLQKRIILRETVKHEQPTQSDQMMSDHKYLNTLANVHQVRFNLKDTQDRYNRMASELQAKLNEKQAKCQEIEHQFKELKRSVAQNAVYSRDGKKLSAITIKEWEKTEDAKD